jgi:hypothetical protein
LRPLLLLLRLPLLLLLASLLVLGLLRLALRPLWLRPLLLLRLPLLLLLASLLVLGLLRLALRPLRLCVCRRAWFLPALLFLRLAALFLLVVLQGVCRGEGPEKQK